MKKPINASASQSVIVFGRPPDTKMARGAKFRAEDRERAIAVAQERGFELIAITDEEAHRLGEDLPDGHFAVNGRPHIPAITPALYDRLRALAGRSSAEDRADAPKSDDQATMVERAADPEAGESDDVFRGGDREPQSSDARDGARAAAPSPTDATDADAAAGGPASAARSEKSGRDEADERAASASVVDPDKATTSAASSEESGGGEQTADATASAAPLCEPVKAAAPINAENAPLPISTAPASLAAQSQVTPALIVFGRTGPGRPRAAWHPLVEAGLARKAAEQQALSCLAVSTPEQFQMASQIGRGKLFGHGVLFAPAVATALFERLTQLAQKAKSERRVETAAPPEPEGPRFPGTWQEIGVGSLVLAPEEDDNGFWEAEALAMTGDDIVLRWLADPEEPVFIRKLAKLALLNPDRAA